MTNRSIRLLESDDKTVTLDREQRRRILEQLRKVEQLEKELKDLKKENRRLTKEIKKLKSTPQMLSSSDKTAEAGGVPSSKTFYRRPRHSMRKRGGQDGHKGVARKKPETNASPVVLSLENCPDCGSTLGEPCDSYARTVTDIPPMRPLVYDLIVNRYSCHACGRRVSGEPPLPPHTAFGPSLASFVATMRMQATSFEKIAMLLKQFFSIHVSKATLQRIEQWVADRLRPKYMKLKASLKSHKHCNLDETSLRVNGDNGWMWVASTNSSSVYVIANTRGKRVPIELLSGYSGVMVHDAWKPYDAITTARHQLDLLHTNRWFERAEVRHGIEPRSLLGNEKAKMVRRGRPPDELISFGDEYRSIISYAVSKKGGTERARLMAFRKCTARMEHLLSRPYHDADCIRISKELRRRKDTLFTFLKHPGVPWHNNDAENAIRQGVLHRKISGGRRTWKGAGSLQCILSVYRTSLKKGINFTELVLRSLVSDWFIARIPQIDVPES